MPWLLLRTAPHAELKCSAKLSQFDFPNHVFKHQITCVRRAKLVTQLYPAFPGYLFALIIDERRLLLQQLWQFFNLISFVRVGECVGVTAALDALLARSLPGDVLPVDNEQGSRFKFGDKVQIITHNHAAYGINGIYQYTVRPGRVCILSPWLGQLVPIEIDEADIDLMQNGRGRRSGRRKRRHQHKLYKTSGIVQAAHSATC
jgi:hypothetical protein